MLPDQILPQLLDLSHTLLTAKAALHREVTFSAKSTLGVLEEKNENLPDGKSALGNFPRGGESVMGDVVSVRKVCLTEDRSAGKRRTCMEF